MLFKKIGQYTREINEFKMKNQRLDHENIVIKQDVRVCLFAWLILLFLKIVITNIIKLQRLQTQLKYMQTNFDELEQSEQRLNKEKREAQREVILQKLIIFYLLL